MDQYLTPRVIKFKEYAIESHKKVNGEYDGLPYSYHLCEALRYAIRFLELVPEEHCEDVLCAVLGHDLIEDTNENYNSVKKNSNVYTAEIIRACTNYGRGRNRVERMPDFVYLDIKETPGGLFVKLCDRLANVYHSKNKGSGMFYTYKKEQARFKAMLYTANYLEPMWNLLESYFEIENI